MRLNLCFLRPTRVHNPNDISIGSAVLAELAAEFPILTMGSSFSKNCPFRLGILTPSYKQFLGPTRVLNPNGTSIGSAVLHRRPQMSYSTGPEPMWHGLSNNPTKIWNFQKRLGLHDRLMAPSVQRGKVWLTPTTRCRAVTLPRRETRWN